MDNLKLSSSDQHDRRKRLEMDSIQSPLQTSPLYLCCVCVFLCNLDQCSSGVETTSVGFSGQRPIFAGNVATGVINRSG